MKQRFSFISVLALGMASSLSAFADDSVVLMKGFYVSAKDSPISLRATCIKRDDSSGHCLDLEISEYSDNGRLINFNRVLAHDSNPADIDARIQKLNDRSLKGLTYAIKWGFNIAQAAAGATNEHEGGEFGAPLAAYVVVAPVDIALAPIEATAHIASVISLKHRIRKSIRILSDFVRNESTADAPTIRNGDSYNSVLCGVYSMNPGGWGCE